MRILELIADQAPANFAMVMSTGIISVAMHLLGMETGALILVAVNIVMFVVLACTWVVRLALFPKKFIHDLGDHVRGPGFLTAVAGTSLVGNQCALILGHFSLAIFFFWCAVAIWLVFLWGVFTALFVEESKPPVEKGINGAWLLGTVSTQALVILGCVVVEHAGWNSEWAFFILAAMYGFGYMMYILVITMILYRLSYKPLPAAEADPSFWVNSGAIAITTLAGSELILRVPVSPFLYSIEPFLKGMSVMAWGMSTWWLGIMLFMGIWRHVHQSFPFKYVPSYWSLVFPTGTYVACTIMLSHALKISFLMYVPEIFIYVALLAWACTFYGLCHFLVMSLWGQNAVSIEK